MAVRVGSRADARHAIDLAVTSQCNLRLVACGHIHEAYGRTCVGETLVVNASVCDLRHAAVNPPVVVDL